MNDPLRAFSARSSAKGYAIGVDTRAKCKMMVMLRGVMMKDGRKEMMANLMYPRMIDLRIIRGRQ